MTYRPVAARRPIWRGMVWRRMGWSAGLVWDLTPARGVAGAMWRSFAVARRAEP